MATGAPPLFGTITWIDSRHTDRDPAAHGVDLAMELQIAERSGEPLPAVAGSPRVGRLTRAWGWLHALPFVGHRH